VLWLELVPSFWEAGRARMVSPDRHTGTVVGPSHDPIREVPHGALLVFGLPDLLPVLAARFGDDSRVHSASPDEAFARRWFTWHS
jgi:hypothetical protein